MMFGSVAMGFLDCQTTGLAGKQLSRVLRRLAPGYQGVGAGAVQSLASESPAPAQASGPCGRGPQEPIFSSKR